MSKMAAIDYAVCAQLRQDRPNEANPINYRGAMNAAPHHYDRNGLQTFLINVAMRLKLDTPSLTLNWSALDIDTCLAATLTVFENYIAMSATVDPPAK